jgi:hypothetical protein
MNATLTWWGVSVAIVNHSSLAGGVVLTNSALTKVVPVFVAIMVWLIRVLVIGSFSIAGERLFSQGDARSLQRPSRPVLQPASPLTSRPRPSLSTSFSPASKIARPEAGYPRPEPTYHNLALNAKSVREAEYVDGPRHS